MLIRCFGISQTTLGNDGLMKLPSTTTTSGVLTIESVKAAAKTTPYYQYPGQAAKDKAALAVAQAKANATNAIAQANLQQKMNDFNKNASQQIAAAVNKNNTVAYDNSFHSPTFGHSLGTVSILPTNNPFNSNNYTPSLGLSSSNRVYTTGFSLSTASGNSLSSSSLGNSHWTSSSSFTSNPSNTFTTTSSSNNNSTQINDHTKILLPYGSELNTVDTWMGLPYDPNGEVITFTTPNAVTFAGE